MKSMKNLLLLIIAAGILIPGVGFSEFQMPDFKDYQVNVYEFEKHKKPFDDPTPILKVFGLKQILPPELYDFLTADVRDMQRLWEKTVGFKSPDVVGKIVPEIKPGKYTYRDVQQNPGFKELMPDWVYERIAPGGEGTGFPGNIPEFEIVPTRQYYYHPRIAQATLDNMGKTKQDEDGYIITETLTPGLPFPHPSGPHKAQQYMYNVENRYIGFEFAHYLTNRIYGINHKFKIDFDGVASASTIRTANRLLIPPYGWLDERAEKMGERRSYALSFLAPRDIAGVTQGGAYYLDADKFDQLMLYIPAMRRVRKMTATDTQDPIIGTDNIYDDSEGWFQKLSKKRYPYKYEVLEEREYLVPAPTWDGSCYISKKEKYAFKGLQFERRPIVVLKLTQLDPNYVYSKRVLYIDREHLIFYMNQSYDQKGRLYRDFSVNYGFEPEMGMLTWSGSLILQRDHIDTHSTIMQPYQIPACFDRSAVSMQGIMKKAFK